jgi:hypothetical protein
LRAGGAVYLDVRLRPGLWISPARLLAEIGSIGYVGRPSDVLLTLTGTIITEGDHLVLRLSDVRSATPTFALIAGEGRGKRAKEFHDRLSRELEAQAGKMVEVEGYWRDAQKDRLLTLLVIRTTANTNE